MLLFFYFKNAIAKTCNQRLCDLRSKTPTKLNFAKACLGKIYFEQKLTIDFTSSKINFYHALVSVYTVHKIVSVYERIFTLFKQKFGTPVYRLTSV